MVVVLRNDYCVPFKDSYPCSHIPAAYLPCCVRSPLALALRQEVEARLANGALEITLGPGPDFPVVSS